MFKYGIQGCEVLSKRLIQELQVLDTKTRLNISGNYYGDFHVLKRPEIEVDINWSPGVWRIQMRTATARREVELIPGTECYLDCSWNKLFLFAHGHLFPCEQDKEIIVMDFDVNTEESCVTFYGQFFDQFRGIYLDFRTKFSFSITNHFLRIVTAFSDGKTYNKVGDRMMKQPDTPSSDFFR